VNVKGAVSREPSKVLRDHAHLRGAVRMPRRRTPASYAEDSSEGEGESAKPPRARTPGKRASKKAPDSSDEERAAARPAKKAARPAPDSSDEERAAARPVASPQKVHQSWLTATSPVKPSPPAKPPPAKPPPAKPPPPVVDQPAAAAKPAANEKPTAAKSKAVAAAAEGSSASSKPKREPAAAPTPAPAPAAPPPAEEHKSARQQLEESLGLAAGALKKRKLKAMISAMVEEEGVDNLSAKGVRLKLEDELRLPRDALKPQKSVLGQIIDEVMEAKPENSIS